jgi:hypothetical protein
LKKDGEVSEKEPTAVSYTPTDPSLEYDLFEMVRLRLAGALERRGYGEIEAERIALYLVEVSRPVANFLRVLTRVRPPEDEEIVEALGKVLDEYKALEKARCLLLRAGEEGQD